MNPTKRALDTSAATIQVERSYPITDQAAGNVYPSWLIRPGRGQWGVPLYFRPYRYWHDGRDYNPERRYLGYAWRRVKWVPRLGQLTPLPWSMPQNLLNADQLYPFDFYPSGRPSYRSTLVEE